MTIQSNNFLQHFVRYSRNFERFDLATTLIFVCIDGTDFMGERLIVQFARGSRRIENPHYQERPTPRPRRTPFRMQISNLPVETSWQVS